MAIADWIRDANEKRKQQLRDEGRIEGYDMGYDDGAEGKPRRPTTERINRNGNSGNGASK